MLYTIDYSLLHFSHICSKSRKFWIILILSIIILENVTLFIQQFFLIKPCVLCIYQRCALYGIAIAGAISAIAPNTFLRFFGIIIWIYSASYGLFLSKKHINIIFHPSPFGTCDLFVQFPSWFQLNKWWPMMFNANNSDCSLYTWYFLSFELSQWMFIIFLNYFIASLIIMISQFYYPTKNDISIK